MADPTAIFVYDTLMPGHLRWGLVEPHAVVHRPATVPGRLFDTGLGWPAAVLETGGIGGGVRVPGVVVVVAALAGGTLLGILGALIAIPVAAAILLIIKQVIVPRQNEL